MKRSYSTDLTDAEWQCLEPHVPAPSKRGRPRIHATRIILDAIFYVLRSGCPWRLLPRDLERLGRPSTTTSDDGASAVPGKRVNRTIRELLRARLGRNPQPSARIEWTRSRPRRAEWAEKKREDTTMVRRSAAGSDRAAGGHRGFCSQGSRVHSAKIPDQDGL